MRDHGIDEYQQALQRNCKECGEQYTVGQYLESSDNYFSRPWNYRAGCETHCLACWLGVGPHDFPAEEDEQQAAIDPPVASEEGPVSEDLQPDREQEGWPYEAVYESVMDGDLLPAFEWFLNRGENLAVMPISRLHVEGTTVFPGAITFYPPGQADLDKLNLIPNREDTTSLSEHCSATSGITQEILDHHALVVFPCRFDWEVFRRSSHKAHLDFIRWMSEEIDRSCLDFVRYKSCRLDRFDDLPAHAGQVASNHMMAGALLYSGVVREARIIGGAAFTHYLTPGLGLPLDQLEWDAFPKDGEVGQIVNHALSLYSALLESGNPTARFMQALTLLEFLAFPDEYRKFEDVKKVIARYIAHDPTEYQRILDRFFELTGKKDPDTGRIIGYRTRVVHMGERVERLVPDPQARSQLFVELDSYIRPVIDHMAAHSEMRFEDYLRVRDTLRPFEKRNPEEDIPF
jgi:hypothetical protein